MAALRVLLCACLTVAAAVELPWAQARPPRADVTPLVENDGVAAGATARVALKVVLPEKLHANSNKPRDPSLIPTVVTVTPPDGVTVDEIVYPEAEDLIQTGADQPLSVFEREFVIGVSLRIAPGTAPGDVTVPARLRYQACDESICYIPATAQVE